MNQIGHIRSRRILRARWNACRVLVALFCLTGFFLVPAQIASAATQGEAIVNAAASQAGVPYCEPGGSLNGPTACGGKPATFDCSGLAMYAVYQGTGGGVALPHGAGMDHVAGGVPVSRANLQPGDLVFFGPGFNGADFHHVGIYAGNGMMWDANTAFWIYGDGVQERSLAAIENELGFDGAVRYWSGSAGGGGGIGEGSYVQVSGHGEVFKIVGGAPLYVSNWNAVGGPQPVTAISQQQFDSLRPYPADGTLVNTTDDGRVYEIAGGAPLYVSSWDAIGGPQPAIAIDGWDVANPGNPAAHLRQYPADGTLINTTNDGRVYEIAGGAPLYVSSWSAIGGSRPSVAVDGWDVANVGNPYAHLREHPADGTLVNTTDDGRVYEIAGGAPLYVSSWDAIGGPQPAIAIDGWDVANPGNPAAHLRQYPADGTLINTTNDGRVYEIAGGAPLYVSSWSAIGGSRPSVAVDGWDVANVGNPYAHLREHPADGTLVNTTDDGRVYEIAGGAPLYVSSWDAIGGPQPAIAIDGWDVANPGNPAAHLRQYPADGTLINTTNDGRVYVVAGGAPLYLSSWSAIGGSRPSVAVDGWDVANAANPYAHLRPYPADGTFLNTSVGRVYRVAGGAPITVSSWSVFGGVQPYTTVDQWDVDNDSSLYAHLRPAPLDGTEVEGLPSHTYWLFGGGLRSSSPAGAEAVTVDDAGLAAFPVRSPTGAASSSAPTASPAPATSGVSATTNTGSTNRKSCHKIRDRGKRARCRSAARHRKHRKAHSRGSIRAYRPTLIPGRS